MIKNYNQTLLLMFFGMCVWLLHLNMQSKITKTHDNGFTAPIIKNALTLVMASDGLRPDTSLQTLDAFHLGICHDGFCFPCVHLY